MAADALRLASATGPSNAPQLEPRFPEQLAAEIFPGVPLPDALEAVEGLLAGLSAARGGEWHGATPGPSAHHVPQHAGSLGMYEPIVHAGSSAQCPCSRGRAPLCPNAYVWVRLTCSRAALLRGVWRHFLWWIPT